MLAVAAVAPGCAGSGELAKHVEASDAELQVEIEDLRRAQEASYDRERALAERLRRAEESVAALEAEVGAQAERIAAFASPVDTLSGTAPAAADVAAGPFDASAAYHAAFTLHQDRQFVPAIAGFAEILTRAPTSSLADNAQYWTGEAHYVLGRYRQALAAFTKVLSFGATEKADDAQLMIARSYLALGERDQAVAGFRKLLELHADSEYVDEARKELRYLEGP